MQVYLFDFTFNVLFIRYFCGDRVFVFFWEYDTISCPKRAPTFVSTLQTDEAEKIFIPSSEWFVDEDFVVFLLFINREIKTASGHTLQIFTWSHQLINVLAAQKLCSDHRISFCFFKTVASHNVFSLHCQTSSFKYFYCDFLRVFSMEWCDSANLDAFTQAISF